MFRPQTNSQVRFLATAAKTTTSTGANSTPSTSLYAFKKQLDDYIYYHSLSSTWRPYVYRKRNADFLISKNALDKNNHPLIPLSYPGTPSKKKLTKFISLILTIDEINLLKTSLNELFKIRIPSKKTLNGKKVNTKYLEPSIINQFLYKSFELDYKTYSKNLMWLDQINEKDSIWSVKNTECIAFLNSLLVKDNFSSNNDINFENQFNKKLGHYVQKADLDPKKSILFNASSIIASIYSNNLNSNLGSLTNLDNLTNNNVYSVKPNTDYLQYDHAYSIISALKDASLSTPEAKDNAKLQEVVQRWSTFLNDVKAIKGNTSSTYELLSQKPTVLEQAAEAEPAAEAEADAEAKETK